LPFNPPDFWPLASAFRFPILAFQIERSGFDLVLANPPYVRQEKIKELKPFLQNACD
jgi:type I restriction-modification system DNA methylase subunit